MHFDRSPSTRRAAKIRGARKITHVRVTAHDRYRVPRDDGSAARVIAGMFV